MEVKVGKKMAPKKMSKVSSQNKLIVVQCWLTQGLEPNENMQPILWTKQLIGALVGGGSLLPLVPTK
jgi:hypothetical protein